MMEMDVFANVLPDADMEAVAKESEEGLSEKARTYRVMVKSGMMREIHLFMKTMLSKEKITIVSDETVASLCSENVKRNLVQAGFDASLWTFPPGEGSKNMATLSELLESMAERGMSKSDLLLSIGGGVTADIAGLAASLYMGGIRFVHAPTTLLSACDSCIGGRHFVNLGRSRGSCGSILFPDAVCIDAELIARSKSAIIGQGMVEVIRAALIGGEELLDLAESDAAEDELEEMICKCVGIRNEWVGKSGKEIAERRMVTLGRVFARAIEKVTDFSLGYPKSMGTGLLLTMRAAVSLGFCDRQPLDRVFRLLSRCGLVAEDGFSFGDIKGAILRENKIGKGYLNFVVPYAIGDCRIVKADLKDLDEWVHGAVDFENGRF